jgi:hypothetical protein
VLDAIDSSNVKALQAALTALREALPQEMVRQLVWMAAIDVPNVDILKVQQQPDFRSVLTHLLLAVGGKRETS